MLFVDIDIDVPEEVASKTEAPSVYITPENVQALCDMGFSDKQARKALTKTVRSIHVID